MVTYGIYLQRSHDATLVNRVRSAEYAKRDARRRARETGQQFFVDEERWADETAERARIFQTDVGRYTPPTPGIEQHGRYRFGTGA